MRAAGTPQRLAAEFAPRALFGALTGALVLYMLAVILALSVVALIYSGPALAPLLPGAIAGLLIGNAVLVATVALFGAAPNAVGPAQDSTGVIIGLGTAATVAALPAAAPAVQQASVAALVALVTLAMGLVYVLLGVFRLGGIVRFLPHPVMGGFLAGTGWLLLKGGIGVAVSVPFDARLLEPAQLARWGPALALGLVLFWAMRRWRHAALVAALCGAGALLFYALVPALGLQHATLAADGWLLGPFPADLGWRLPLTQASLAAVDWPAVLQALPAAAPALLIGAIALLLNTSALELIVRRDIALDRDLRTYGAANAAAALAGGAIGYTAISLSSLSHSMAPGRRLPGVLLAAMLLATAWLGTELVAAIPRFVMAGLVLFIGLALLHEWLVVAGRQLPRGEYAVVLAIFAVIVATNLLWGVALGLFATTLLFVLEYSRVGVVRHALDGAAAASRRHRSPHERERLQQDASRLLLVRLQGFIFFGSAQGLLDRLRRQLDAAVGGRRYLVIDFAHVSGIDTTALASFGKLAQVAAERDAVLVLAALPARQHARFDAAADLAPLRRFADADHALEWCEEQLLASASLPAAGLREQLLALLPGADAARVDALLDATTQRRVAAGEHLMRRGDDGGALYFVASGRFTAQLERASGERPVRLQTVHAGAVLGELGFVLGTPRSADVVADVDSVVHAIDRAHWQALQALRPDVTRALDALLLRLLGERTAHLTRVVEQLER